MLTFSLIPLPITIGILPVEKGSRKPSPIGHKVRSRMFGFHVFYSTPCTFKSVGFVCPEPKKCAQSALHRMFGVYVFHPDDPDSYREDAILMAFSQMFKCPHEFSTHIHVGVQIRPSFPLSLLRAGFPIKHHLKIPRCQRHHMCIEKALVENLS